MTIPRLARVLEAGRVVMFALLMAAGGVTLSTAMDRATPVLAATVRGATLADVYRPGDLVSGEWTVTAVRVCDGHAERWVRVERADGGPAWSLRLPDAPLRLGDFAAEIPGTVSYPITSFSLPADTPAGTARYHHRDFWTCSWPGDYFFPTVVDYAPIIFRVEPAASPGL